MSKIGDPYTGPVVFVEGVHYPVDDEGHADKTHEHGLRWDNDKGGYYFASAGEASHHETYHSNDVDIEFPGEEPVRVSEDEAAAVKAFLAQMRGENA